MDWLKSTFDTSQAARAGSVGLDVNTLVKPLGPEPEETRSKKDLSCPGRHAAQPS